MIDICSTWWFISCVIWTSLRDAQRAGKHYFWVCVWGCFQKKLAFKSDWVKKIHLHQSGLVLYAIFWGPPPQNKKGKGSVNPCSLFLSWHIRLLLPSDSEDAVVWCSDSRIYTSIPLAFRPLASDRELTPLVFLVLRPVDSNWIIPPAFLDL